MLGRRLLAALLAGVALAGGPAACSGSGDPSPASAPTPFATAGSTSTSEATSASTDASAGPAVTVIDEAEGVVSVEAEPFPDWVTIAGEFAWVANVGDGVARYDRATGALVGTTPTGTEICLAMDAGPDSLWLGDCATTSLVRVDLATGETRATIDLPVESITDESSVAVADAGVYVLGEGGTEIVHVDPASNAAVGTFAAPTGASALRAGDGSLWVTSTTEKTLSRLDPGTGQVLATIGVGSGARFLAVGEGAVWVMNSFDGTVSRVDPASNTVVATIEVSPSYIDGGDIAVGGGSVWVRASDVLVARIDPGTNAVVSRLGPAQGSGGVAADDSAVWISAHEAFRIWRVPIA